MKNLKKWTAMAVSACMAAGLLAGCGGTEGTGGQDAEQLEESSQGSQGDAGESGGETSEESQDSQTSGEAYNGVSGNTPVVDGEIDTSQFVTVKMLVLGDPPAGDTDKKMLEVLNPILEERMNANLEMTWIEWNNYETKYQMELVSGTPYDLVFTSSTWLNLWDNVSKNAFMDITDLLPYYAPQLWADTTEGEWAQCRYDGRIYALPEHRMWQLSTPGFAYRLDWAREFGLDRVASMDDLEKYCDGILEKKAGVIPFNVSGSINSTEFYTLWINQDTDYVFGPGTVGMNAPTANVSLDDCWTIASPIFDDEFVDFAIKMKEWGDRGYWPTDVLSATIDAETMFLSGQSGLYHANVANLYGLYEKMEKEDPDAEIDIFFDAEKRGKVVADSVTQDACAVSAYAANPERALMMYDLFQYDEEIYHLTQYGVEGVNYAVDEDGYRVKPEGYDDQMDAYYWDMWSTRNDSLNIPEFNPNQSKIDEINAKIKPWSVTSPWGSFMLDTSMVENEITAINEAATTWLPAIQFGKAGDPEAAVEELRSALKGAGIDAYIEEVNRQMSVMK